MSLPDLNVERLRDITGGDPELNAELVRIVLEDAEAAIAGLGPALHASDAEGGRGLAHRLKGAAANGGAERLAEAALRLEHAFDQGDANSASAAFDDVLAVFATLREVAASLEVAR
jgi:HPt (histidine-containing phosphotransfer) domain-containing protein